MPLLLLFPQNGTPTLPDMWQRPTHHCRFSLSSSHFSMRSFLNTALPLPPSFLFSFSIFTVSYKVFYEHLPYFGVLIYNCFQNQTASWDHVEFIFCTSRGPHVELLPEGWREEGREGRKKGGRETGMGESLTLESIIYSFIQSIFQSTL